MRYIVEIDGHRREVQLDGEGVHLDGERLEAHLADVEGTPVQHVTIGREQHRVVVRRGASRGAYLLWIDGHRFEVEALDERTRAIRDLTGGDGAATGPRPLAAPMPGLVVRVLVAAGDVVVEGQGLVVMEAMKMENELRASAAGTIRAVHAAPGRAVEKGALLVEFE